MAKLYNLPNMTTGGDQLIEQMANQLIVLPIMFLVFIFTLVFFSGSSLQLRRSGYSDIPLWFLIAFLTCDLLALIMTLGSGVINLTILSVLVSLTLMSALWFFLSRGRFEN